jgi:hypothetical protein
MLWGLTLKLVLVTSTGPKVNFRLNPVPASPCTFKSENDTDPVFGVRALVPVKQFWFVVPAKTCQ